MLPYRVLDLTDHGALVGGQILGDLGADVLLVEPPAGVGERRVGPFAGDRPGADRSLSFWATNRNKRSIVLDLEAEADRRRFRELAATADLLLDSRPVGYLSARGLGYQDLATLNPRLVMVSITPFGLEGPKAAWAATDLTVTAASGVLAMTGDDDRPPVTVSIPQAYLNAGAEAAVGALIALAGREASGLGQHVDVSAQTAMMMTTQSFVLCHGWNDREVRRVGGGMRLGDIRLRFVYPCKDGHVNVTFLFGKAIGPATARLFEWMYEEGFVDEATRDKDWVRYGGLLLTGQEPIEELDRCTAAIERFTRSHTKAELFEASFSQSVLIVPVSDIADLRQSVQLEARRFWVEVADTQTGRPVTFPGPFARLSATPIAYRRRPPRLGEHTSEVDTGSHQAAIQQARGTATASGAADLPLNGLRVLDFTWVYAGPAATRYLADYGATVVRVESATRVDALRASQPFKDGRFGAERSGNYSNVNVGKLGLSLNMAVPEARALALRLVGWADVLTENFSPKAMRAWGMDYASLRQLNPGLVMVSTCLNGQDGPQAMLAGYGTMGAALAGFGELTGWPDRAPAAPFLAYTDYTAPKFIVAALLAALDHRRRTGEGQHIDCSQAESAIHFLGPAVLDYAVNGRIQGRMGNARGDYAPSGVYPAAGPDRWVAIAAPDDGTWLRLSQAAGRGWASDRRFQEAAGRLAHAEALDRAIADWTVQRSVDEVEDVLQRARVPAHRVSTSEDLFADPQLHARGHFVWLEHPTMGAIPLETSRMRFSRTPAVASWPGPVYGQHNDEVLRTILGLSDEEIVELAASGALE